jgi:hypothetical protein
MGKIIAQHHGENHYGVAQHHGENHCPTSWGKSLPNIMGEIITVLGNHKGLPLQSRSVKKKCTVEKSILIYLPTKNILNCLSFCNKSILHSSSPYKTYISQNLYQNDDL